MLYEVITPVQVAAEAAGLEVRTPVSLKDPAEQAAFKALDADAPERVARRLSRNNFV